MHTHTHTHTHTHVAKVNKEELAIFRSIKLKGKNHTDNTNVKLVDNMKRALTKFNLKLWTVTG
jgi:hypothetical protein